MPAFLSFCSKRPASIGVVYTPDMITNFVNPEHSTIVFIFVRPGRSDKNENIKQMPIQVQSFPFIQIVLKSRLTGTRPANRKTEPINIQLSKSIKTPIIMQPIIIDIGDQIGSNLVVRNPIHKMTIPISDKKESNVMVFKTPVIRVS